MSPLKCVKCSKGHLWPHVLVQEHERKLWWPLSLSPPLSVSVVPRLCSLWCVQPEVSCQKTLMSEEGRRGERGGRECVREGGEREGKKRARRKSLILSRAPSLPNLSLNCHSSFSLHPPVSFPFSSSFSLFAASHLPSSQTLITLCIFLSLSHTHTHIWASQPHTPAAIRQDSASASISRAVSIWHRASRPLRHSPVPPHPALLVTWDNWGRNPDCEKKKLTLGLALSSAQEMRGCF